MSQNAPWGLFYKGAKLELRAWSANSTGPAGVINQSYHHLQSLHPPNTNTGN